MEIHHNHREDNFVQSLAIEKLIHDSHRRQLIKSGILESASITLGSEQFVLLMVDILDYIPGKLTLKMKRSTDRDAELHKLVEEYFISKFCDHFYTYAYLNGGQSYIVLNLQTTNPFPTKQWIQELMNTVFDSCSECVDELMEQYGVSVRVFLSDFVPTLDDLGSRKEWMDAMLANDYIGIKEERVIASSDMDVELLSSNVITPQIQGLVCRIIELSQKHRFREAHQAMVTLLQMEVRHYGAAAGMRSRLSGLITVLYSVIGIPYYTEYMEELQCHRVLLSISNAMDATELIDDIKQLFANFEYYFTETTKTTQQRMVDVAEYIHRNHTDPMLCVASISEHFDINPSYLSRLFKEKRNEKLIDCIHKTRLRHAKQLLSETHETIEAIATTVGYQNSQTFARAFKRYEGVTPGAFRTTPISTDEESCHEGL